MSAADPSGAVVAYLKTTDAGDAVSGNVFRPELPDRKKGAGPPVAIVIRRAGGYGLFGDANIPVGDPTLDVFCYGETWLQSEQIADLAVIALKTLATRTVRQTRLYWARIAGGPNPFADPDTNWPCTVLSAQVAFCELSLA